MYALIDISNQMLEDSAFDHAGASLRKAGLAVAAARCHPLACWGVDEASLPSHTRTRTAIALISVWVALTVMSPFALLIAGAGEDETHEVPE